VKDGELLISEHNWHEYVADVVVDGERKSRGGIPRPYETYPVGCYGAATPFYAVDMPIIPESEWASRLQEKVAAQAQLSDIRMSGNNGQMIPSLDQNGFGYCWFHSGTSATIMLRAVANLPYVSLSAYAGACVIKNYRNEGGWGAQGLDFIMARGVPSDQFWPQRSVNPANDTPACWANAALHKVTEGFIDLQAAQYDRNLSRLQVATCLLSNIPVIVDFSWWSHSVCALDLVDGSQQRKKTRMSSGKLASMKEFEVIWGMNTGEVGAGYGVRVWNSWGDSWSSNGMGTLAASKAWPDGAVAPRATVASVA
jgi:hypothetical protein